MKLLPMAPWAALLVIAPAVLAGGLGGVPPTTDGGGVCLPESVGEACVLVREPRCVDAACDNPCLQRARMITADSTTINGVCGIPADPNPCSGRACPADCFDKEPSEPVADACGRPLPMPVGDPCSAMPCGGEEDDESVCLALPNVYCCLNSEGDEVSFEVYGQLGGANYNVIVLRELLFGADLQKDVRVGWNNQVPESRKAVTFHLTSSNRVSWMDWPDGDPHTGWYVPEVTVVATNAVGTLGCGPILYPSMGTPTDPAIAQVQAWFSGLTIGKDESTNVGVTTSTSVESTSSESRTWENEVRVELSYETAGGATRRDSKTYTEEHSYSTGTTGTYEEGVTVTFTPTEWIFDSAPFYVG